MNSLLFPSNDLNKKDIVLQKQRQAPLSNTLDGRSTKINK
jgi:hypothetical protein